MVKCKCFTKIPYKKFCSNISLVNFFCKKKKKKKKGKEKKVILECSHIHLHIASLTAFTLQRQSRVVVSDHVFSKA